MWVALNNKDDFSPKGLLAEIPNVPLPVLSNLASANATLESDDIFKPELDTLLTLLVQILDKPISNATVHKLGSLSANSNSISFNVSKSSVLRSLLNFISSIIVLAFSGESI